MLTRNKLMLALLSNVFVFSAAGAVEKEQTENAAATTLSPPKCEQAPILDDNNLTYHLNEPIFAFPAPVEGFKEYSELLTYMSGWKKSFSGQISQFRNTSYQEVPWQVNYKKSSRKNKGEFDALFIVLSVNSGDKIAYIIDNKNADITRIETFGSEIKVFLEDGTNFPLLGGSFLPHKPIPYPQAVLALRDDLKTDLPSTKIVGKKLYLQAPNSFRRERWEIIGWNYGEKDKNVFDLMKGAGHWGEDLKKILPYRCEEEQKEKDYINYNFPKLKGLPIAHYMIKSSWNFNQYWEMIIRREESSCLLFKTYPLSKKGFNDLKVEYK